MNKQKLNLSLISTILAVGMTTLSASANIVDWQQSQPTSPPNGANFYLLGMTNNSILAAENSVVTIPFAGAANASGQTLIESDSEAIQATLDSNSLVVVVNEVEEDTAVNLRVVDEQNTEYAITINVVNNPTFAMDNYDASLFSTINIGDTVIRDTQDWLETDNQPLSVPHISYGRTASLQPGFTQPLPTVGQYYSRVGSSLMAPRGSNPAETETPSNQPMAPIAYNNPYDSSISNKGLFLTGQEKEKAVSSMQHRQLRFEPKPDDEQALQNPVDEEPNIREQVNDIINNLGGESQQDNDSGGNSGGEPSSSPDSPDSLVVVPVVPVDTQEPSEPAGGNTPNNGVTQPVAIPVPASWTLFGLALAGIAFMTRKSPSVVG